MQVIFAFIRRDALKNHPFLYPLYLIVDSGLWLIYWYFLYFFLIKHSGPQTDFSSKLSGNLFSYGLAGLAFSQYIWRGFSIFSTRIANEQANGSLESLWMTAYPLPLLVFLSSIWNFILVNVNAGLMLIIGIFSYGAALEWDGILKLMEIGLLTSLTMGSLGLLASSPNLAWGRWTFLNQFLSKIIFFLSGAFFPISFFPQWLKILTWFLPTTHALMLIRGILSPSFAVNDPIKTWAAFYITTTIVIILSWIIFSRAVHQARVNGRISGYAA